MIQKIVQGMLTLFILELVVMIWLGSKLGIIITISWLFLSSVIGFLLAREHGYGAIRTVQQQLSAGQPPGHTILKGVLLFLGAALLIFPGFISDIFGILLFIPFTRQFFHKLLYTWLRDRAFRQVH
jgi:UPF0716 protein FxsA